MERFLTPAALARCVPFVLFMVLLAVRGELPTDADSAIDPRWVYGVSVLLVSASLAYSTVIFASLFGVLLWGEVLPLPAWLAIGLIVASGMLASAQSRAPAGQD
mgnify:CR=1 FL=1